MSLFNDEQLNLFKTNITKENDFDDITKENDFIIIKFLLKYNRW